MEVWSMKIRASGGNCQYIHRNNGGLHACTLQANSHISCRAHAAPLPCSDHAALKATSQGHVTARQGRGTCTAWARHGMCVLTSAVSRRPVGNLPNFGFFRLQSKHSRRLLTRMLLPFRMCVTVLMTMGTADCKEHELNLRFKVSLSSVVMLRLHRVFFFLILCGQISKYPF